MSSTGELGQRLRDLRHEAGMTLSQAAEQADLSLGFVADIEKGRRAPSLESLRRLSAVYGLDVVGALRGVQPYDEGDPRGSEG